LTSDKYHLWKSSSLNLVTLHGDTGLIYHMKFFRILNFVTTLEFFRTSNSVQVYTVHVYCKNENNENIQYRDDNGKSHLHV